MQTLHGRVALVAGGTRGAGRGIAVELGAAGATVYVSGRSTREQRSDMDRPETIEETAELVTAAGGDGIPVRCDHGDPGQVRDLAERITATHGRLDILVNDVWGGDPLSEWGTPFWEMDLDKARAMWERAVFTHLVTSRHTVPLMLRTPGGLIVEISDGLGREYRGNLPYDLVKTAVNRLALAQAEELREHGITAVGVTPGFLRSEAMLDHFGVTEANWRDGGRTDPHFLASETPHYVGRAVAALAADPAVSKRSGQVLTSWDLAEEYGFTDVDGRRPHWDRHMRGEPELPAR
ncbi:NAD(P)-dependent dehydrogenase (short-subunit alcohol dehydrogenase family) [Actinoplanes octamycinicus]|uniref:NAD(P)-dependent dehydrogenase (Short-subunit alcohol dehydrogenase family) n=1 Tax=Actinoplanes octamycinicus TaxID=135948 RepID=A0A7W7M8S9_9ACTN|nr:SDR family oxidoreductase [Actinoplanes octamycinicus]MBB4741091.1 NAD(P)-dependent dehydrogenase (short-subunit alcohol dehydrogenase family) [Actinoplanes octamycinicus]GIE55996.1 short-chain dehydrogenase [Actinoplanes octamycinicus]